MLARPGRESSLPDDPRLVTVPGDLNEDSALAELVTGAQVVLHLAGAVRGGTRIEFLQVNVSGTRRLADAIARYAPDAHLIYVSSLAARHPELSWYADSKRAAEESIPGRHDRWTILRPPAVYGPDDPALAPFWRWLARGWLLRAGPADARFSLLHVDDLCAALVRLGGTAHTGAILELHDNRDRGYDWALLADIAARHLGRQPRVIPVSRNLLRVIATTNLALGPVRRTPPLLTPGKLRELAHPEWVCDNAALAGVLGWSPTIRLEHCLHTLPGWNSKS